MHTWRTKNIIRKYLQSGTSDKRVIFHFGFFLLWIEVQILKRRCCAGISSVLNSRLLKPPLLLSVSHFREDKRCLTWYCPIYAEHPQRNWSVYRMYALPPSTVSPFMGKIASFCSFTARNEHSSALSISWTPPLWVLVWYWCWWSLTVKFSSIIAPLTLRIAKVTSGIVRPQTGNRNVGTATFSKIYVSRIWLNLDCALIGWLFNTKKVSRLEHR